MPDLKAKKENVTRSPMSAADAQAAAEAAAVKAAAELKAKQEAEARAKEAKEKVEAYQRQKAAEAAKAEREQNARNREAHDKVAAYPAQQAAAAPKPKTYVVKAGDSLSKIAKEQLGDAKRYPEIQKLNKIDNPNLIRVGQELLLPE